MSQVQFYLRRQNDMEVLHSKNQLPGKKIIW